MTSIQIICTLLISTPSLYTILTTIQIIITTQSFTFTNYHKGTNNFPLISKFFYNIYKKIILLQEIQLYMYFQRKLGKCMIQTHCGLWALSMMKRQINQNQYQICQKSILFIQKAQNRLVNIYKKLYIKCDCISVKINMFFYCSSFFIIMI